MVGPARWRLAGLPQSVGTWRTQLDAETMSPIGSDMTLRRKVRVARQFNRINYTSTTYTAWEHPNSLTPFVGIFRSRFRPPDLASGGRGARSAQHYPIGRVVFLEFFVLPER